MAYRSTGTPLHLTEQDVALAQVQALEETSLAHSPDAAL
jgi:hypothetical protein